MTTYTIIWPGPPRTITAAQICLWYADAVEDRLLDGLSVDCITTATKVRALHRAGLITLKETKHEA